MTTLRRAAAAMLLAAAAARPATTTLSERSRAWAKRTDAEIRDSQAAKAILG